jgi:hypothetical protein
MKANARVQLGGKSFKSVVHDDIEALAKFHRAPAGVLEFAASLQDLAGRFHRRWRLWWEPTSRFCRPFHLQRIGAALVPSSFRIDFTQRVICLRQVPCRNSDTGRILAASVPPFISASYRSGRPADAFHSRRFKSSRVCIFLLLNALFIRRRGTTFAIGYYSAGRTSEGGDSFKPRAATRLEVDP